MATSITKDNTHNISVEKSDKSRDSAFFSSASSSSSIADSRITSPTPKKKKLQSFKKFFVKSSPQVESPSSSISPPSPPKKKRALKEIFVSKGKSSHKPIKPKQKTDKRTTKKEGLEMLQKYGVCEKSVIGKGATAVVRIAHKSDNSGCEKLYAVKEFRHRRKNESEKEYIKKLASEFCISSSLRNSNIVETVDLIKNENGHWVQIMEYVPTDLYHIIKGGRMGSTEIDCCFKQLVRGVAYMHSAGVAHRDLKPENLLMNEHGQLKITDFGASDVFHVSWEKKAHLSKGLCGSEPYIAPEVYKCREYNAQLVDIWSIGIVHYCMLFQGIPFQAAVPTDPSYSQYLIAHASRNYTPFERMSKPCSDLMYRIIDPNPKSRITMAEILESEWFKSIEVCSNCQTSNGEHHHILDGHHNLAKSKF